MKGPLPTVTRASFETRTRPTGGTMTTATTAPAPSYTYPSLRAAWIPLAALCLAFFVEMVDNTLLAIALPTSAGAGGRHQHRHRLGSTWPGRGAGAQDGMCWSGCALRFPGRDRPRCDPA